MIIWQKTASKLDGKYKSKKFGISVKNSNSYLHNTAFSERDFPMEFIKINSSKSVEK